MSGNASAASPMIEFLVAAPDVTARLLATHVDDGSGHCRACPLGAQAGYHTWPCSIVTAARRAAAEPLR
ncbi:MAG: hypothetical protein AB7I38_17150 [Dehalococcoidia bacterium]